MVYCDDSIKAVINLDNIKHNIGLIKNRLKSETAIAAVVKADAYGHGAVRVSEAALEAGASVLAVATSAEGVELREAGIKAPVIVLSRGENYKADVLYDLTNCVFDTDAAVGLNEAAEAAGKVADIHIKINTGMSRLGFNATDPGSYNEILKISTFKNLRIKGILSHYATADIIAQREFANVQSERFLKIITELEKRGLYIPVKHICNSGGIFNLPSMHLDMVRCGIAMYGCAPDDSLKDYGLKPALSLKSRILSIREVSPGETVSYGRRFTAGRPSRIAVVSGGYADGIKRIFSDNAYVLINGKRAPITGRVCMDVFMADITDIPDAKKGSEVIIIGESGSESLNADILGAGANTISYEILTSISKRVPREYIGSIGKK